MPRGAAALPRDGRGGAGREDAAAAGRGGDGRRMRRRWWRQQQQQAEERAAMRCCAGPGPRGGGALTTLLLTGRSRRRLGAESGHGPGWSARRLRLRRPPSPAGRCGYGLPRGRPARPAAAEARGGSEVPAEGRALARRRCAVGWLRAGRGAAASAVGRALGPLLSRAQSGLSRRVPSRPPRRSYLPARALSAAAAGLGLRRFSFRSLVA